MRKIWSSEEQKIRLNLVLNINQYVKTCGLQWFSTRSLDVTYGRKYGVTSEDQMHCSVTGDLTRQIWYYTTSKYLDYVLLSHNNPSLIIITSSSVSY